MMFTKDSIHEAYAKVQSGADFPQGVQDLKALGVVSYDHWVADGTTNYLGENQFVLMGEARYPELTIHDIGSAEKLQQAPSVHQQGQTNYLSFCKYAAEAGVEKWITDLSTLTVRYFDKEDRALLMEPIPLPR